MYKGVKKLEKFKMLKIIRVGSGFFLGVNI